MATKVKKTTTKKATAKPKHRFLTATELNSMKKPLQSAIRAYTKIIEKGVAFPDKEKQIKKLRSKLIEINNQFGWTVAIQ